MQSGVSMNQFLLRSEVASINSWRKSEGLLVPLPQKKRHMQQLQGSFQVKDKITCWTWLSANIRSHSIFKRFLFVMTLAFFKGVWGITLGPLHLFALMTRHWICYSPRRHISSIKILSPRLGAVTWVRCGAVTRLGESWKPRDCVEWLSTARRTVWLCGGTNRFLSNTLLQLSGTSSVLTIVFY